MFPNQEVSGQGGEGIHGACRLCHYQAPHTLWGGGEGERRASLPPGTASTRCCVALGHPSACSAPAQGRRRHTSWRELGSQALRPEPCGEPVSADQDPVADASAAPGPGLRHTRQGDARVGCEPRMRQRVPRMRMAGAEGVVTPGSPMGPERRE